MDDFQLPPEYTSFVRKIKDKDIVIIRRLPKNKRMKGERNIYMKNYREKNSKHIKLRAIINYYKKKMIQERKDCPEDRIEYINNIINGLIIISIQENPDMEELERLKEMMNIRKYTKKIQGN